MEPDASQFDVVIAGGGAAGLLAAARLAIAQPTVRIALLEKEPVLGGRLRGTDRAAQVYGYGLNAASPALHEFWRQTLLAGDGHEISAEEAAADRRQLRFGVLAGQKIAEVPIELCFSAKGARTLGGLVAAREWTEVDGIFRAGASAAGPASAPPRKARRSAADPAAEAGEESADHQDDDLEDLGSTLDHPVSYYWKRTRKAASAEVLEHFASAFGIPDVWNAAAAAVSERAQYYESRLYAGGWDEAMRQLSSRPWFQDCVTVLTETRIVDARYDDSLWTLSTDAGPISARSLIVAQPPWQAVVWLKRPLWPAALLHVASKTKPVSSVVLCEHIEAPDLDIPDVVLVPSENAQIVRNGAHEICFQATIDFELSMQAPAVVKAVRSLKRARKKLLTMYPGSITELGHIALIPVAWAQPPSQSERRWLLRAGKKPQNLPTLAFCGDAYGTSYDGDANVIKSLLAACTAVLDGISRPV